MASRLFRSIESAVVSAIGDEACEEEAMRRGAFQHRSKDISGYRFAGREGGVPRWVVVCGVVAYCAVAWMAVFHFGGQATDWLVAMMNNDSLRAANDLNLGAR